MKNVKLVLSVAVVAMMFGLTSCGNSMKNDAKKLIDLTMKWGETYNKLNNCYDCSNEQLVKLKEEAEARKTKASEFFKKLEEKYKDPNKFEEFQKIWEQELEKVRETEKAKEDSEDK
ncbi:MAG: hypothetical protein LBO06_08790 [Bacteroidales bacterium]|jgi:hypothetical protein|nr:hypothetical protein [Bacteroidales bacterium]